MSEFNITTKNNLKIISISGRIDGISSTEIEKEFNLLTSSGERIIVVDFTDVNYISSAGLRIFLITQNNLLKIGGELILVNLKSSVREVFRISGFERVIKIYNDISELDNVNQKSSNSNIITETINNKNISILIKISEKGEIKLIGSTTKLSNSEYSESDVVDIDANSMKYSIGLAALGDSYPDYKNLFGESVVIDNNFYNYPATKTTAVDYMLKDEIYSGLKIKYLNGFSYTGQVGTIINFSDINEAINVNELLSLTNKYSSSNIYAIVLLGISFGFYGMNLKKTPVKENHNSESSIFDKDNFANWMDFSFEPTFSNNIIASTGLVVKDKTILPDNYKQIFSSESSSHLHAVIFETDLISKDTNEFENELSRVLKEIRPLKVQHILNNTAFKSGFIGIIEMEIK